MLHLYIDKKDLLFTPNTGSNNNSAHAVEKCKILLKLIRYKPERLPNAYLQEFKFIRGSACTNEANFLFLVGGPGALIHKMRPASDANAIQNCPHDEKSKTSERNEAQRVH